MSGGRRRRQLRDGCANIPAVSRSGLHTLRFSILPWVLGALFLRALIPPGFMHVPGTTLPAEMCAPGTDAGLVERIEIPGAGTERESAAHCDACLIPTLATPPATYATADGPVASEPPPLHYESPQSRFALIRAQLARAPPV